MRRYTSLIALALMATAVCAQDKKSAEPKSIGLTIYNENYALVRDTRSLDLKKGTNTVEIGDVAGGLDPTSVLMRSITAPNSLQILEQNYQYDLITPDNILDKSVGEKVMLRRHASDGRVYTETGILLNPTKAPVFEEQMGNPFGGGGRGVNYQHAGGIALRLDDGRVVLRPEGELTLEKMPAGLHPRPVLQWMLDSTRDGSQDVEISYMTDGIGWKANYVALYNDEDSTVDLAGWVTLDNKSGATYEDAKLTLMAGDVRRVQPPQPDMRKLRMMAMEMAAAPEPQFQEKSFFEYHVYTLNRTTTIRDNERKQMSLLNAEKAPAKKELIYDPRGPWFRNWWFPGRVGYGPGEGIDTQSGKLNIVIELENSEKNNMGMPLPKGTVRVYQRDEDGAQQFIGEDEIDHTPRDERIRLYIGDAFDVVGEFKRMDFRVTGRSSVEESFEVTIRNHKDKAVNAKFVDHVWGEWAVKNNSHSFNKVDARTIEFPLSVDANGEVKVTYTIRTEW